MSKITRRNYSRDFKIEAVRLVEAEGYNLVEACLRLGISKSALSKWKKLYGHNNGHNNSTGSVAGKDVGLTVFEQKQLQKELERVRRERDILKKALAYFAADPQK